VDSLHGGMLQQKPIFSEGATIRGVAADERRREGTGNGAVVLSFKDSIKTHKSCCSRGHPTTERRKGVLARSIRLEERGGKKAAWVKERDVRARVASVRLAVSIRGCSGNASSNKVECENFSGETHENARKRERGGAVKN